MKNLLGLLAVTFSAIGWASHTVCSSPNLYYSSVRGDFGTAPPAGMKVGRLTVVYEAKVLLDIDYVSGLGGYTLPKYSVTFEGPRKELAKEGGPVAGSAVYSDVAVLKQNSPFSSAAKEIARTPVVCETTWKMVP